MATYSRYRYIHDMTYTYMVHKLHMTQINKKIYPQYIYYIILIYTLYTCMYCTQFKFLVHCTVLHVLLLLLAPTPTYLRVR